jgi:ribosomal protein S24E
MFNGRYNQMFFASILAQTELESQLLGRLSLQSVIRHSGDRTLSQQLIQASIRKMHPVTETQQKRGAIRTMPQETVFSKITQNSKERYP